MFRQKIAQVASCTCRLIPNDKNDFSIFRATVNGEKSLHKDHKEKYSLKTQAISSGKTDSKLISAKKTISKISKVSEQDKISITGNIDSKKKKLDRYKICSPQSTVPRNFDETQTPSGSLPKNESNFSNLAYVFRTRDQSKVLEQLKTKADESESKTFGALKKFTIAHQNARTILTSLSSSEKNKQNTFKARNMQQKEKLNDRADKSLKKIRQIFDRQLPFKQVNSNTTYQIVHGSLQKQDKTRNQSSLSKGRQHFLTSKLHGLSNLPTMDSKNLIKNTDISEGKSEKYLATDRNISRDDYCQSEQFKNFLNSMRSNSVEKIPNQLPLTSRASSINSKVQTHKKLSTFNDLMGDKKLSESILSDEEENENENSIVVMTLKDLIEKNKEGTKKDLEDINKLSFIKHTNNKEAHKESMVTHDSDIQALLKHNGSFFRQINNEVL